nr:MAG TPA: hypothetical protein [Caudoviricetes sp.]
MKILKIIWILFENVCFAIGFFVCISLLTAILGGGNISATKNGEQVYCFPTNNKNCVNTSSEEIKHEQN